MNTQGNPSFITVDFHCHTHYSHDSSNRIDGLLQIARERGFDKLAITDHNTIQGALKAKALAPEMVIIGEEVLTERGELIAYFLNEEVPPRLSVPETLQRFKDQGAFICIPHPFDIYRHGWRFAELVDLLPEVDAIEVFNARCLRRIYNDRALNFALERGISMLAGSDAHSLVEIGLARTFLPDFHTTEELQIALQNARISGTRLSAADHLKASAQIGLARLNPKKKS